jgi:alkanesulfonate monooxygenase SsuD/methylene tetrahydromethanopterin reductase-like flavin-dependent oxidoreductase (luciferase family)
MRRAARIGDGWYPIGANPQHRLDTMARYRAAVERLRKLAADVGRDPASVALAFRVHRHGASAPAKADNGERFLFSGSNAEIIDDLRAMRELGVKAIDFNFAALTVDAMRRFHEEVVAKS